MKKNIILLLFLLVVPFIVYADNCDNGNVKIKSIYRKEKTENVEEIKEPIVENKKINLNLKMNEVGDSITYKVLVENQTNEDYELNESNLLVDSDYFKYTLDTNDKVIKANTEKEIDLRVVYNKEVDENKFENGVYTDNQDLVVSLSNEDINQNPVTQANFIILILFILLILQLSIYCVWLKKKNSQTLLLIITILLIPISTRALCKVDLQVESRVQIEKISKFCLKTYKYENNGYILNKEEYIDFENGMTWVEYIESEYNIRDNVKYIDYYKRDPEQISLSPNNVCHNIISSKQYSVTKNDLIKSRYVTCYEYYSTFC